MNIVILGAGSIGSYLAIVLSKEEHNVTLIDKDPQKLEKISREADIATLCGYGSEWKLLDDLLETSPSHFIAMTGDDETNLVACSIAKNLGYPITVARVKDIGFLARSRLDFGRLFFVDHFIGAEVLAAHDILKSIISPVDLAIENFAYGAIQMRTIVVPDTWNKENLPISELNLPEEIIISLIRRKKEQMDLDPEEPHEEIIFPHGDDHILKKDEITIIGETKIMHEIPAIFKTPEKAVKYVIIIGGSPIALHLAKILEKLNIKVKIIEKNEARCNELAEILPKTTIINHSGADFAFLLSEQIQNAEITVTCTHKDETNLLISLLAQEAGCKKVISVISDISLSSLLKDLNINFSVSEKVNIANRILSIIYAETIISVTSLYDNRAKVVEIKTSPDSELVGIPLADLATKLPKDLLIAAIENRGKVMIGKGSRIISPNDTVILMCSPENMQKLPELF